MVYLSFVHIKFVFTPLSACDLGLKLVCYLGQVDKSHKLSFKSLLIIWSSYLGPTFQNDPNYNVK